MGNVFVGKTSIIQRIFGREFIDNQATVGVEFEEFKVENIDKETDISLQIWDTCN